MSESETAGRDVENVTKAREQAREQIADQREQHRESLSIKEQLEQAARDHRVTVDIYHLEVPFREPEVSELVTLAELGETIESETGGDGEDPDINSFGDRMNEMWEKTCTILANNHAGDETDHITDEDVAAMDDPEWWDDILGMSQMFSVIQQLLGLMDDIAESEEIEEFRSE